jgi:hypothetical protein
MGQQISGSSNSIAIWAYIVQMLQNEMNVGAGGPGTGANTSGRLQSVQFIYDTIHLYGDRLPAIGVQIAEDDRSQQWQRAQDTFLDFKVVVAAKATPVAGITTLSNAYHGVLMPLLDDGNGNGLVAVLQDRSIGNATCGGLTMFNRVTGIKYDWDVDKAVGTTDARAYAYVNYRCQITISN